MRTLTRNMSFSRSVRVSTSLGVNCARGDDERHRGGNDQRRRGVEDDAALGSDGGPAGLFGRQEDRHVDVAQLEHGDHLAAGRQHLARLGEPVQHPTPDRATERAVVDVRADALDPGGGRGDGRLTVVDVDPAAVSVASTASLLGFLLGRAASAVCRWAWASTRAPSAAWSGGALLGQRGLRRLHPRQILVELLAGDQVLREQRLRSAQLLVGQRQLALALDDSGVRPSPELAPALGDGGVGAAAIALPLGDGGHCALQVALALGDGRDARAAGPRAPARLGLGLAEVRVEVPRVHPGEDLAGLDHVALATRTAAIRPGRFVAMSYSVASMRPFPDAKPAGSAGPRSRCTSFVATVRASVAYARSAQAPSPRKSSATPRTIHRVG